METPLMTASTTDLRVNPADETIRLGPLAVRFLLTADQSTGSLAAFEVMVPGGQRLAAPAHSHDQYDETIYGVEGVLTWTVNGQSIEVGVGQALCIPRGASVGSTITAPTTPEPSANHAGRDRPAVLSRIGRGPQCRGRGSARPGED